VKSIKLSGGEPTIRNDLPEIVDIVHASGMIPTVTSNGLRVSGQLISAMARAKGKIKFSVHYPDERNDGIIRPKSFELIRRNARRIVEAGVPFGINCVVSKDNYPAMTSMAKLSEDWGAKKITFFPVISRGLAKRNEYETEMTLSFRKDVCCFSMVISDMFPNLRVRCIDLNTDEYWIVDHDGRFFISKGEEFDDTIIFNNSSWFR